MGALEKCISSLEERIWIVLHELDREGNGEEIAGLR